MCHTPTCTYACTCIQMCAHTCIYVCTRTCTHMHTYIYTPHGFCYTSLLCTILEHPTVNLAKAGRTFPRILFSIRFWVRISQEGNLQEVENCCSTTEVLQYAGGRGSQQSVLLYPPLLPIIVPGLPPDVGKRHSCPQTASYPAPLQAT